MPGRLLRRGIHTLHFVGGCLVGGVLLVAVSAAGLVHVLAAGSPSTTTSVMAGLFSRLMQTVLGWRIDVANREGLPSGSAAVVLVRHQSNVDVVPLGAIYTARSVAIGKKELERIPFFGWFWRATGNVLVDRGNRASAIASMEAAAGKARREGLTVWAAPEGHRNMSQSLLPFKKGVFHLAIAGQLPIVPVAVEPIATVFDARRWVLRPGRIRIQVLAPVLTAGCTPADVDRLVATVRTAMQEAQDALWVTSRGAIA